MSNIAIQPTQWGTLPDIDSVRRPLTELDSACLAEVRSVLSKHGRLDRFGIVLLHKHFELDADEALVETIDQENRILTVQPVKRRDVAGAIPTQWSLASEDAAQWCQTSCIWTDMKHVAQPHRSRDD